MRLLSIHLALMIAVSVLQAQAPKDVSKKPGEGAPIDSVLGISPGFKACAVWDRASVKVVDLHTGKKLASPMWDRDWGTPLSATFGNQVLAIASSSGAVKVFSRKTGVLEQNIQCHQVSQVAFTAGGRFLAIIAIRGGQGFLVLRDVQGKKTVAEVGLGGAPGYYPLALATAKKHVAIYDSVVDRVRVVEAETGKVVKKITAAGFRKWQRGAPLPLALSPSGHLLACAAGDAVVLIADLGGLAHTLEGHLDLVSAVAFSSNGEILASSGKDKTIRFWNVKEGKEIYTIKTLPEGASELIFSSDGKRIAIVYRKSGFGYRSLGKVEIRPLKLKVEGDVAKRAERDPAPKLEEAKKLLVDAATREKGKRLLQEVVKEFRRTKPGEEARKLLEAETRKEAELEKADKRAVAHLKYARKLIDDGMAEKARERLQEIIKKYPGTKTAEEARKLLEGLKN